MAIQFPCAGCRQPIEVDDELAGREAACPYCHRVITVPATSTYAPAPFVTARPADPAAAAARSTFPPPPVPATRDAGLHVGPAPEDARARSARIYGGYALICSLLVLGLFTASTVLSFKASMAARSKLPADRQPSMEEMLKAWESVAGTTEGRYAGVTGNGALFFALVGVAFAIASLRARVAGNWRGWLSVVGCGGILLCVCGAGILIFAMTSGA